MSAVNEWVVREYFESLGFLVSQPVKYAIPGRQKTADEEVDFIIFNPQVRELKVPSHLIWGAHDLKTVPRAVVGILGWHTDRVYAATFEQMPDLLRFVEAEPVRFATKLLGSGSMARILCLPRLPVSGDLKDKTIKVLKEKGVDGVISFQTMLEELIARVDINRNYDKSDLLQIIRLLKNYELLKDTQMDLFEKHKRRAGKDPRQASSQKPAPPQAESENGQKAEDQKPEDKKQ